MRIIGYEIGQRTGNTDKNLRIEQFFTKSFPVSLFFTLIIAFFIIKPYT